MLRYTLPVLALFGLAACDGDGNIDTDTDTDSDTGEEFFDGPTELDTIDAPACEGGEIVIAATTVGWTNGENLVNIWEQGAPEGNRWHEEHDLPSVQHDPNGAWDELEIRLASGAGSYERGEASLFSCDGSTIDHSSVYAIRVYDADGNLADCAIFADDVPGGVDQVLSGDTDENEAGFVKPSNRSELTSSNCDTWTL